MSKKCVMYMHTLEGRPANFTNRLGAFVYFCGGLRAVASLVPTLRQLRREQQAAIAAADADDLQRRDGWNDPKKYGYVRVELPHA